MDDPDISTQTDLSEGTLSDKTLRFDEDYLKQQRQKRRFRFVSFLFAWVIAALFLLSVLCFSYRIFHQPTWYWHYSSSIKSDLPNKNESLSNTVSNGSDKNLVKNKSSHGESGELLPTGSIINQMLILLGLLSAVGTTMAISVMRFSFSEEGKPEDDNCTAPTVPIVTSISELVKALVDTLKKDK